jgi:hypothetical protein
VEPSFRCVRVRIELRKTGTECSVSAEKAGNHGKVKNPSLWEARLGHPLATSRQRFGFGSLTGELLCYELEEPKNLFTAAQKPRFFC